MLHPTVPWVCNKFTQTVACNLASCSSNLSWSAAKESIPCFSFSTAISSASCSSLNCFSVISDNRSSELPPIVGQSLRSRGAVLACSSSSSCGDIVMLSHLKQPAQGTGDRQHCDMAMLGAFHLIDKQVWTARLAQIYIGSELQIIAVQICLGFLFSLLKRSAYTAILARARCRNNSVDHAWCQRSPAVHNARPEGRSAYCSACHQPTPLKTHPPTHPPASPTLQAL